MKFFGVLVLCCVALGADGHRFRRLAGGSELASPGEFRFHASLQVNGQHICGGSLISRTHVLTAAHCVANIIASKNPMIFDQLIIEVGSNTIGGGQRHRIQRIAHRKDFANADIFNPYVIKSDMAVITLKTPVAESATVGTIDLPTEATLVRIQDVVTIAGFGSSVVNGQQSSVLKKTKLQIVSNQECDAYYTATLHKKISDHLLCAKLAPGYGTCTGDSGGPMLHEGKLVAIVSGGDGHCGAGNPDFFTEVSHFLTFIRQAMQGRAQGYPDTEELDASDLPVYQPQAPAETYPQVPWYPWPQVEGYPQPPVILIPQNPQYWPVVYQ